MDAGSESVRAQENIIVFNSDNNEDGIRKTLCHLFVVYNPDYILNNENDYVASCTIKCVLFWIYGTYRPKLIWLNGCLCKVFLTK